MDRLTIAIAIARGLHLAALLSLVGTLMFAAWLAPSSVRPALARLARISAGLAIVFGAAWLVAESGVIASATGPADTLASVPSVARFTRFGELMSLRLALLLAVLPLVAIPWLGTRRPGLWLALALSGAGAALQGAIGHAGAMENGTGTGLLLSEAIHLLAASAWLGGLLPLLICLRRLPPQDAARVCLGFSPLGLASVMLIAGTGLAQAWELVGSLQALVGTTYGRLALLKIALFLVALAFAARNRLSLTDRLIGADPARARRQLARSVSAETVVGLMVVLTAAVMASQVPGIHAQPGSPFPWRLDLSALGDPVLWRRTVLAAAVIGAELVLLAASLLWRRGRVLALLMALTLAAWQGPNLGLLLAKAYPAGFHVSPTGPSAGAVVARPVLFAANCKVCHGLEGQGDGPTVSGLPARPTQLMAPHPPSDSDGTLFGRLTLGTPAMPASAPGGTEYLIDSNGWLRAISKPGYPRTWHGPATLAEGVRTVRGHPIVIARRGEHDHHH